MVFRLRYNKVSFKKGFKVNVLVRKNSNVDNLKNISSKINFFMEILETMNHS